MADPTPTDAPEEDEPTRSSGGQGRTLLVGLGLGVAVLIAIVAALALTGGQDEGVTTTANGVPPATPGFGLSNAVSELPDATLGGFAGAPDVEVADLLGGPPLVINFWATWCAPCVAEMPDFQALHEAGEGAFRLVGINTRDAAINAEDFVEELGITYEQAVDVDGSYFVATGGFGMPTTLFVRPDGSVAYRQTGPLAIEEMQDLLAQHLDVRVTADAE